MSTTTEQTVAQQQVIGLRALADLIEANPELAKTLRYAFHQIDAFSDDPAVLAEFMRAGRRHGATTTKDGGSRFFTASVSWGPLTVNINAERDQVCERVVTGTETVTKTVKDPTALAAVPDVEVTETVETFEWVCKPLLATEASA